MQLVPRARVCGGRGLEGQEMGCFLRVWLPVIAISYTLVFPISKIAEPSALVSTSN